VKPWDLIGWAVVVVAAWIVLAALAGIVLESLAVRASRGVEPRPGQLWRIGTARMRLEPGPTWPTLRVVSGAASWLETVDQWRERARAQGGILLDAGDDCEPGSIVDGWRREWARHTQPKGTE
jgi:hypothetical protein